MTDNHNPARQTRAMGLHAEGGYAPADKLPLVGEHASAFPTTLMTSREPAKPFLFSQDGLQLNPDAVAEALKDKPATFGFDFGVETSAPETVWINGNKYVLAGKQGE